CCALIRSPMCYTSLGWPVLVLHLLIDTRCDHRDRRSLGATTEAGAEEPSGHALPEGEVFTGTVSIPDGRAHATHVGCRRDWKMRRIYYTSMGLSLFPTVAFAQTKFPAGAPGLWYMHVAVVVCGLFLAAYWAVEAFSRPSVTLGEIPTLPKYMTRRTQYRWGVLTFTILSVLLYALVAYLHREVLPLIKIYNADLYETF